MISPFFKSADARWALGWWRPRRGPVGIGMGAGATDAATGAFAWREELTPPRADVQVRHRWFSPTTRTGNLRGRSPLGRSLADAERELPCPPAVGRPPPPCGRRSDRRPLSRGRTHSGERGARFFRPNRRPTDSTETDFKPLRIPKATEARLGRFGRVGRVVARRRGGVRTPPRATAFARCRDLG